MKMAGFHHHTLDGIISSNHGFFHDLSTIFPRQPTRGKTNSLTKKEKEKKDPNVVKSESCEKPSILSLLLSIFLIKTEKTKMSPIHHHSSRKDTQTATATSTSTSIHASRQQRRRVLRNIYPPLGGGVLW